jgi:hypothetical protein
MKQHKTKKGGIMGRVAYFIVFLSMGYASPALADDTCCNENDNCESPTKGHVQTFFSGEAPRGVVTDPREDYEWPGMNEDTFYDYFTK